MLPWRDRSQVRLLSCVSFARGRRNSSTPTPSASSVITRGQKQHCQKRITSRLSGTTPLKKPLCYYPSPTTLQVGKSHNSPPSSNYNNSKVAEASIKGNFNKAKSLTGRNKELQQNIMKDRAGWSSVYFVLLSNTRLWKKVKVSLR